MPLSLWVILALIAGWGGTWAVSNVKHSIALARLEKSVRSEERATCNVRVTDIANGLRTDAEGKVLDGMEAAAGVTPIEAAEIKDMCMASPLCRSHGAVK